MTVANQVVSLPLGATAVEVRALPIECQGESMLGLLTTPKDRAPSRALLIVNGGPQYRVGSHRLFVQLSRHLAEQGLAVLRFDFRGTGDSTGNPLPFTAHHEDIKAALAAMRTALGHPGMSIDLFGLCDGASAALMFCGEQRDAGIGRLVLLNPWVHSPETHAQVQIKHYYRQRVLSGDFWARLVRGKIGPAALVNLLKQLGRLASSDSTPTPSHAGGTTDRELSRFQDRMKNGMHEFKGPVCLILSGQDFTAAEFKQACTSDSGWRAAVARESVQTHTVAEADHTFSSPSAKESLLRLVRAFMTAPHETGHSLGEPPTHQAKPSAGPACRTLPHVTMNPRTRHE